MASSYVGLTALILTLVGLAAMGLGLLVGVRAKRAGAALISVVGILVVLLVGLLVGMRRLPVSGPLLTQQVLAFWLEIAAALLGGAIIGIVGPTRKRSQVRIMLLVTLALIVSALTVQARNIQLVLQTLQDAGVLKTQGAKDDYKPETNKDCPANLQNLYNAFEQYAELNDSLPPAEKWLDNTDFTSRIPQDEQTHCPAVSNGHDAKFGYAYNDTLAGKKLHLNGKPLNTLPNAATTPLVYDSTNVSKSAHDAVTSLPTPGRHSGRNNILYLDGHVAAVAPK